MEGEMTEANRKYWDEKAPDYDAQPWQKAFIQRETDELRARKEWLGIKEGSEGEVIRVLDYACGPGTVSWALQPYNTQLRGVDLAPSMVERYNARAKAEGLYPDKLCAIEGNILSPSSQLLEPEYHNFDAVVVGFGFHHFEDPPLAAKRLVERLRPGKGVLIITELLPLPHSHSSDHGPLSEAGHTLSRHGFDRAEIERIMTDAGCDGFEMEVFPEPVQVVDGGREFEVKIFIAKATRKA